MADNQRADAFGFMGNEYMPAQYFDVWNGFPGQGSYFPIKGEFNPNLLYIVCKKKTL